MRAVKKVPVRSLTGKLIATPVRLANGTGVWALLGNIDASSPRLTEHFLTVSIERKGKWFTLARYHDFDYDKHGPNALARFLGLKVGDVFPSSFDVRDHAQGDPAGLRGVVREEPTERLSRAEIIAMAVP